MDYEEIDTAVRDITELPYRSKSEVRSIIESLLSEKVQQAKAAGIQEEAIECFEHCEKARQEGREQSAEYLEFIVSRCATWGQEELLKHIEAAKHPTKVYQQGGSSIEIKGGLGWEKHPSSSQQV